MYTLIIHLYALGVQLLAPFHKKARTMRLGQWRTNKILRDHIDPHARYIWFHAASLGEFEQGRPMIEKIKAEHPEYKILLTFFSPSGYEVQKNYPGADVICYLPFDTPFRVQKFLTLANPVMAIFVKYEFWANYLTELHKRQIPTYIISALFRKEQLFFRWYGKPYRKVLSFYKHIFVQDVNSKNILAAYGIDQVSVCGDTRFDRVMEVQQLARVIPPVEILRQQAGANHQKVVIAGSSWPPDDEILITYFNEHPEIRLVIAPHEISREHLLYIQSLLTRPFVLLSEADETNMQTCDCLIVDGFGLLSSIYRYGDIAYIGGGFGAGIHNILEAAVYGIPVVFGPKYHKFKEAKDLIREGGGFSVQGQKSFTTQMDTLIKDPDYLKRSGKVAGDFVSIHTGVTAKIMNAIFSVCK
ncbi:MAG: 3-deoxy-D-manno-octulosonic acid transferase [Tannerellaceae bacterium]|nr:3-deoxy-D-manno-octulosonic acid transferase [Tannerellaceae bacterium]